jgi:NADH dehydrogenase/NADH:ubiquinone oxidoreductase subunit G
MDVMYAVDWWTTVPPLKTFLRDECASFKDLLNTGTDFQRELQMLAQQQLKQSNLQRVQVASIGTSGVWLKAAVLQKDKDEKAAILDVPIQFLDQKEAATADDLRESVLNLVELVENLPLVEPAKEPERAMAANEEPAKPMSKAKKEEPAEPVPVAAKAEPSPAEKETTTKPRVLSKEERVAQARQQPKSPKEEAELAAKYAAIEDLGERAYTILVDLGMI